MSNYWWPHGLQTTRLLCPWDSPSKNIGVGCHFLLQGISLTQESNPCLLPGNIWNTLPNFFLIFKIHNFLRNWISNFDNSFKQHILHKHIFKTWHFFSTWLNTKIYYPVPLSMQFSRQDDWSGLPFPALQADSLHLSHQGSPNWIMWDQVLAPLLIPYLGQVT